MFATSYPSLQEAVFSTVAMRKTFRYFFLALVGSVFLAVSAKLKIPFAPVPMTLQTLVVLVLGMAYGWRLAGVTILLYLAEGAVGLPVFSNGSGFSYLYGPTGGYLAGFFFAASVTGWLAERGLDRNFVTTVLAMLIGTFIIFSFGVSWLSIIYGLDDALKMGLYPFIPAAIFKIVAAALIMPLSWKLLGK